MADIHLHTPGGETVVRTEDRVVELLHAGELAAPVLFWRSGMADWEPIANFAATVPACAETQRLPGTQPLPEATPVSKPATTKVPEVAPRGTESTSRPMPEVKPRPAAVETPSGQGHTAGRRRFYFRRNPEPLTTILQVMLVVCICIAALELANAVVRYSSLATELPAMHDANGNPIDASAPASDQISSVSADGGALLTPEPETGGDGIGQLLQWSGWGANALLVVAYFMWLVRTDQNCRNFSSILRFNPEWTVWCYFVPPLCVFRPFQVMQEIWRVSRNPRTWNNDRLSFLVAVWWLLTLATLFGSVYGWLYPFGKQGPSFQADDELIFLVLKLVQLAWYGVFLTMITLIIHNQLRLARRSRRHGPDDEDEE